MGAAGWSLMTKAERRGGRTAGYSKSETRTEGELAGGRLRRTGVGRSAGRGDQQGQYTNQSWKSCLRGNWSQNLPKEPHFSEDGRARVS